MITSTDSKPPGPIAGARTATRELRDLAPDPREEWRRLLNFVQWGADDHRAAIVSIEPLFRAGPDLVAATYAHLASRPETAGLLGWEQHVDATHLEERRRFFTVWLARTLGVDTSDEFALYLFRAGQYHAGDGPRRIDVPPAYVTASVGLVLAGFGDVLSNAPMQNEAVARAMAAWSKFLTIQLDLMLLGYRVARDLHTGPSVIRCTYHGRLRPIVGAAATLVHVAAPASVGDVVRKIISYYPLIRDEALDCEWEARTPGESLWEEDVPVYVPRRGWRVLLNGRDVQYERGFAMCVADGDVVALFPPGR
jgi:molybdopterin converting factor small subunit